MNLPCTSELCKMVMVTSSLIVSAFADFELNEVTVDNDMERVTKRLNNFLVFNVFASL